MAESPTPSDAPQLQYLDDLQPGRRFTSGEYLMDEALIKGFATQFDPQPFHLDHEAAKSTLFGGLAASGWHTAAVTMRLLVDGGLPLAGGIIGASGDLSWLTILNKRENFRAGFANFEAEQVARFDEADVKLLMGDAGIVRHAGKIASTINNARRVIQLRAEFGSFGAYAWRLEPDAASRPKRMTLDALRTATTSPASIALSKDLKKRGWSFVGPTTMYALMQAMGLVNDHVHGCVTRTRALGARAAFTPPVVGR